MNTDLTCLYCHAPAIPGGLCRLHTNLSKPVAKTVRGAYEDGVKVCLKILVENARGAWKGGDLIGSDAITSAIEEITRKTGIKNT